MALIAFFSPTAARPVAGGHGDDVQCGSENERPCYLWEHVPSCDSGLVENFLTGRCVSSGGNGDGGSSLIDWVPPACEPLVGNTTVDLYNYRLLIALPGALLPEYIPHDTVAAPVRVAAGLVLAGLEYCDLTFERDLKLKDDESLASNFADLHGSHTSISGGLGDHDANLGARVDALDAALAALRQENSNMFIEERLASCTMAVSLFLPTEHGGRLEAVGDLVSEWITQVEAAGFSVRKSWLHYQKALAELEKGSFRKAYRNFCRAYDRLTMGDDGANAHQSQAVEASLAVSQAEADADQAQHVRGDTAEPETEADGTQAQHVRGDTAEPEPEADGTQAQQTPDEEVAQPETEAGDDQTRHVSDEAAQSEIETDESVNQQGKKGVKPRPTRGSRVE